MFDMDVIPFDNLELLRKVALKDSLKVMKSKMDRSVTALLGEIKAFQFERQGFFALDTDTDLEKGRIVFNRTLQ